MLNRLLTELYCPLLTDPFPASSDKGYFIKMFRNLMILWTRFKPCSDGISFPHGCVSWNSWSYWVPTDMWPINDHAWPHPQQQGLIINKQDNVCVLKWGGEDPPTSVIYPDSSLIVCRSIRLPTDVVLRHTERTRVRKTNPVWIGIKKNTSILVLNKWDSLLRHPT